jgi:hypothetical protein
MKKLSMLLSVFAAVFFLCNTAGAYSITFENDAIGPKANGWMSVDSNMVTFTDSNGADLDVYDFGGQSNGKAIACNTDYDGSALVMSFAAAMDYLSFDFGNDDGAWLAQGAYVEVQFYSDELLVATGTIAMNLNDLMDQTFVFDEDLAFNKATVEYLGVPLNNQNGLIEIIDNIVFEEADAAPVPEPGTMFLLGSGLFGLVMRGRKKMKK